MKLSIMDKLYFQVNDSLGPDRKKSVLNWKVNESFSVAIGTLFKKQIWYQKNSNREWSKLKKSISILLQVLYATVQSLYHEFSLEST